jgi:hypothetical protein
MANNLWQETGHASQEALLKEVSVLLSNLTDHKDEMTPKESRFIEDMEYRQDHCGSGFVVSAKQLFWLRDLNTKY